MIQEFLSFRGSETSSIIMIHFPAWFWFHIHTGPTRAVDKTPHWLQNAMSASFATTYPVTQKSALNVYKCAKCWFASDPHLPPQPFPHHFLLLFSDAMAWTSHASTSQAVPLCVSALLVTGPGHSPRVEVIEKEGLWTSQEGDVEIPTWSNQIVWSISVTRVLGCSNDVQCW